MENKTMAHHDDLALLQGTWLQISYERDGFSEPVDGELGWHPQTQILDLTFSVTISEGGNILKGVFKLDQTRQPKEIDWTDTDGTYASEHTIKAIYTLTEADFIFCAAYDGAARPTAFKTKKGQVLRRMRRL